MATPNLIIENNPKPHAAPQTPEGFSPAQIRQAYGINNITFTGGVKGDGKGQTIAIVDAFNNPTIVNDLAVFDQTFGLPAPSSFKIVNQNGSSAVSTLPLNDPGWAGEITLDVEWAHAIAPAANILLVETTDNLTTNLLAGVDYARKQPGVVVVSNSWGGLESVGENAGDFIFSTPTGHAGVSFTVSAGDAGGPGNWPSASPNVLSIGGTSLKLTSSNNYSSETVWNDAAMQFGAGGGGQSGFLYQTLDAAIHLAPLEPVPNYQKSIRINGVPLTSRGTPDVSYNADPLTGFAVYSTYAFGGWLPGGVGGTSAGAPQWAALIAIADQGRALMGRSSLSNVQSIMYSLPKSDFHDITIGNNDYLGLGLGLTGNAASPGYDLASGLGTPIANLVVRDLVAASGISFVPASGSAGSVPSTGFFKVRIRSMDAEVGGATDVGSTGGSGNIATDLAAGDTNDMAAVSPQLAGDHAANLGSISPLQDGSDSSGATSPLIDDSAAFSPLGHGRSHHGVASIAQIDSYFAELDSSDLVLVA